MDEKSLSEAASLLKSYGVEVAYLFGSRARGEESALSDVDIGVLFGEEIPAADRFARRLQLASRLCGVFGVRRVDVVDLEDAPPALGFRVIKQGVVIMCTNERRRVRYEARTLIEYIDFKPIAERCERGLLASMGESEQP